MTALITNIQRYAIHDGGGIRTVIFFKGCPLRCAWCHNPETLNFEAEGDFGKPYSVSELVKIALRDSRFYEESGGGVTLSGGEPLAQDGRFLVDLFAALKRYDLHIAVDTCGDVDYSVFAAVLPYVDLFLYDLKLVTPALHEKFTGKPNKRILENLEMLNKEAVLRLRVPVICGVNDGPEMNEIIRAAKEIISPRNRKVSLLPYHAMGQHKLEKLGKSLSAREFFAPGAEILAKLKTDWEAAGFECEVGG